VFISYGQFLSPRPTPKLDDRPFSTISDCVLIIYQRLRIDYMPIYPPQLEAVYSDRNFPS